MTKVTKTQRGERGRFAPGQSGNPAGKVVGSRHKVSLAIDALFEGEAEALARKCIEKALEGDVTALRICLDRIAPPRRDRATSFKLPPIDTAEDAEKASAGLLAAVAAGELSGREAAPVMGLLVAHKDLVEAGTHERRLTLLEEKAALAEARRRCSPA